MNLILSRFILVLLGISLGLLARSILGPPAAESRDKLEIAPFRTVTDQPPSDVSGSGNRETQHQVDGAATTPDSIPDALVAPIKWVGGIADPDSPDSAWTPDEFEHDMAAAFHPHGEELCASGCAASRHPTEKLNRERFHQLLDEYLIEPMDATNNALEELLYYGRQSRNMLARYGASKLSSTRARFLDRELSVTHAVVQIRLVDDDGQVRSWLPATRVPFDRRHVFDMKTKNLQPLVTSGTVKRVGLDHVWTRL